MTIQRVLGGAMLAAAALVGGTVIVSTLGGGGSSDQPVTVSSTAPMTSSIYDLNGDTGVSLADVGIVLSHVGERTNPHFCLYQVEDVAPNILITPESVAPYDFGAPAPTNDDAAFVHVPNTYPDYAGLYAGTAVPLILCADPYLNTPTPDVTPAPTIGP